MGIWERIQAWHERRSPAALVRRLYAEGVIDDEMLLAARGQHPSQLSGAYQRFLDLPKRDIHGDLITAERWAQHGWIDITTFADAGNGFSRWMPEPPRPERVTVPSR